MSCHSRPSSGEASKANDEPSLDRPCFIACPVTQVGEEPTPVTFGKFKKKNKNEVCVRPHGRRDQYATHVSTAQLFIKMRFLPSRLHICMSQGALRHYSCKFRQRHTHITCRSNSATHILRTFRFATSEHDARISTLCDDISSDFLLQTDRLGRTCLHNPLALIMNVCHSFSFLFSIAMCLANGIK